METSILDLPPPAAEHRLVYGTLSTQFADLRVPDGAGPHPVVIIIHGGYWRVRYGLEYLGHLCERLRAHGYATWNVEYRRIGEEGGGWPNTFLDVASAADALRDIAVNYSLDHRRVFALGHSAGGHLASWLASRSRIPVGSILYADSPTQLRGVISLAGVLDLHLAYEWKLSNGAASELLGGSPLNYPERYDAASPAALLPTGVPHLLIHGHKDDNVPHKLSRRYAQRAREAGDEVRLLSPRNATHFDVVDPRSPRWPPVESAILTFLADH